METNFIQYIVKIPIHHEPWKSTDSKQMQESTFDLINEKIKFMDGAARTLILE
jgi:hypothetical protein